MSEFLPALLSGLAVFLFLWSIFQIQSFEKRLQGLFFSLVLGFQAVSIQWIFPLQVSERRSEEPSVPEVSKAPVSFANMDWLGWQQSPYQLRQSVTQEYLVTMRQQGVFLERIRSPKEFSPWSVALLKCIADFEGKTNKPQLQVVAHQCVAQQKLREFLPH
ncbi:hypothetical protein COW36_00775 [bacterium (Candidatus Blackallbacteria) CG17_big_fil_post_rev_8_21_14_2_50_48_46]|uniref:Uncharacterized protein n=1 Tax=bacterium (Candidatus Blackallbacteria) CG17_big_fil_post_rev_8_21_14_2_50_48_46 TaxID=2014261 RepID=A0A2M7GB52_9BACT|nr:MAG: hypothetical protein COW64_10400 [bacterium (Candidatus Blackallbacteria) CG18_big_fil_WC_8_21_14_2_50_49_26]PIW19404.1 MAG: hypothetical protein COW36_00775 [bacterium (Candidatus Blackallbacteria) CG17_big_fil_post_rev_8_21_14_2_50_48_46]PIW48992.1 MAG: hypothetical protein COW20_07680 [bacterium (Candidatus Blackallbacteria) CG13_big_fil_rev_8_21_14_2_50_49_14]